MDQTDKQRMFENGEERACEAPENLDDSIPVKKNELNNEEHGKAMIKKKDTYLGPIINRHMTSSYGEVIFNQSVAAFHTLLFLHSTHSYLKLSAQLTYACSIV